MYINKDVFINNLCSDCRSKQLSMGFIKIKICEETCLTMKVLKQEKTYKLKPNAVKGKRK